MMTTRKPGDDMRWAACACWKAAEANREVRNGARSRAACGSQVVAAQEGGSSHSLCHSARIGSLTALGLRGGDGRSLDGEWAGAEAQRHGRTWASVDQKNKKLGTRQTSSRTWRTAQQSGEHATGSSMV
jgi:hypothetical protein